MRLITPIVMLMLAIYPALTAMAVTDREMEEARTITAKLYLRWANNGSGYLEEVNAKSMAELTPKLKAKELENLKAFNAVKVPADYSTWDKNKLVEFWSATFFTSPQLSEEGKRAKDRVRARVSAMTVTPPTAKPEPKAEEKVAESAPAPADKAETAPASESAADAQAVADAQNTPTAEDILSDQKAIEKDAEESVPATPADDNKTWVYVLVLAILVVVVIWLVYYAASLMKRQPDEDEKPRESSDDSELREQARKAIAKKNEEIDEIRAKLTAETEASESLRRKLAAMSAELDQALATADDLRAENDRLSRQLADSRRREEAEPVRRAEEPRRRPQRDASEQREAPVLKVIYLGRANARGLFVRADRRINPGNTIYRLDTNDGIVGTFHVVDEPEVVDVALSNPTEYLANGCTGEDLEDTVGVTRIVTEGAGTAIFENGAWKVLRKTKIRYE